MTRSKPPRNDELRAARRALGMDQRTLADAVLVSTRTVSRWETLSAEPSLEQRLKIIRALDQAPSHVVEALRQRFRVASHFENAGVRAPGHGAGVLNAPESGAALDALVHRVSQQRDMLLRGFAVELLKLVDQLGLRPGDAASLLEVSSRSPPDRR